MSDRERFLEAVKLAGKHGLHSHTVRRKGISGHPSERARELEAEGVAIRREREFIDGRNGVRFFYEGETKPRPHASRGGPGPSPSSVNEGEVGLSGGAAGRRSPQNLGATSAQSGSTPEQASPSGVEAPLFDGWVIDGEVAA